MKNQLEYEVHKITANQMYAKIARNIRGFRGWLFWWLYNSNDYIFYTFNSIFADYMRSREMVILQRVSYGCYDDILASLKTKREKEFLERLTEDIKNGWTEKADILE